MGSHTVAAGEPVVLERKLGMWSATALNMSNMIGVGPFITLPALMATLYGPQAMLGWGAALLITLPDALIWSELGAALPASGGTYRWLRAGFPGTWGRFVAFLYIWQLVISGPMEIGTGITGFVRYLAYIWPGVADHQLRTPLGIAIVVALCLFVLLLLSRRIGSIAWLSLGAWWGVLATVAMVLVTGLLFFDPRLAFNSGPPFFHVQNSLFDGATPFTWGFWLGIAAGSRIGIYDYLGYYNICYMGDEVRDPGRTIPRSVILSLLLVAAIYVGINLSIIGVVPWWEFTPKAGAEVPESSLYVASLCIERAWNRPTAIVFTVLLLWTAIACIFALVLGYSRVLYAAAADGTFLPYFGKLHSHGYPQRALVFLMFFAALWSFVDLGTVIESLVVLRILVQFLGQIAALVLLRQSQPDLPRPYRVWFYPLPLVIATCGWLAVFFTSGDKLLYAVASLGLGGACYAAWHHFRAARTNDGEPGQ